MEKSGKPFPFSWYEEKMKLIVDEIRVNTHYKNH